MESSPEFYSGPQHSSLDNLKFQQFGKNYRTGKIFYILFLLMCMLIFLIKNPQRKDLHLKKCFNGHLFFTIFYTSLSFFTRRKLNNIFQKGKKIAACVVCDKLLRRVRSFSAHSTFNVLKTVMFLLIRIDFFFFVKSRISSQHYSHHEKFLKIHLWILFQSKKRKKTNIR